MDKYLNYSFEQLLADDNFRQITLNPVKEQQLELNSWIQAHPEKAELFSEAQDVIRSLGITHTPLNEHEKQEAVDQILSLTSRKAPRTSGIVPLSVLTRIAASAVITIGLFMLGKMIMNKPSAGENSAQMVLTQNNSTIAKLIRLPDGSAVVLKPGSYITYPASFETHKRELNLVGEAFFEISKNPEKPFFVHAGGSVTKVLGTSFNIRAFERDERVTVLVKTGKVAVYRQEEEDMITKPVSLLEANQQLQLHKKDNSFQKSILRQEPLYQNDQQTEIPVSELFRKLSQSYGIVIDFDQQKLVNCAVMANLSDLHLLEKLDAICLAINASYTISESQIIITGQGC